MVFLMKGKLLLTPIGYLVMVLKLHKEEVSTFPLTRKYK